MCPCWASTGIILAPLSQYWADTGAECHSIYDIRYTYNFIYGWSLYILCYLYIFCLLKWPKLRVHGFEPFRLVSPEVYACLAGAWPVL